MNQTCQLCTTKGCVLDSGSPPDSADAMARGIYARAELPDDQPRGMWELARRLLGEDALAWSSEHQHRIVTVRFRPVEIRVRTGLGDPVITCALALGIARVWLRENPPARKMPTSLLALALALPARALAGAVERFGEDTDRLAAEFVVPRGIVARRLAARERVHLPIVAA